MTPAIWLRYRLQQVTKHAVQLAGEHTLFRAQMKADCGALGALSLHLWDRTDIHTQWWGKALVTERGLWCPAFTLSCFHANCLTNRRAQASPLHTTGPEVRWAIYGACLTDGTSVWQQSINHCRKVQNCYHQQHSSFPLEILWDVERCKYHRHMLMRTTKV